MGYLNNISHELQTLGVKATDTLTLPGQTVERLSSEIFARLQNATTSALQRWIDAHPLMAWMLHHPIWALGMITFLIFMLWGLLNAIARLTERLWLSLLQAPLKLSQWLLSKSPQLVKRIVRAKVATNDSKKQLLEVMNRLEELRKEQDQLLEQIKTLMASQH